jgi:hypothetical protein
MARAKQETNRSAEFCSKLLVVAAIGIGLAVSTQAHPPLGIVAVLAAFVCVAIWATNRRRLRRVVIDAVQKHQPVSSEDAPNFSGPTPTELSKPPGG